MTCTYTCIDICIAMPMLTYSFFIIIYLNIAKNYILDLTDHSKGSQSIMFSDDLKLYLRNTCSTPPLKPFVPRIETIEMFEKKVNLIHYIWSRPFLNCFYTLKK